MSLFRPQLWRIPTTGEAERRRLPELTATLETRLKHIARRYPQAVFASSLAVEDMIITDAICRLKLPLRIITLDTGKLNPETAALITAVNVRYQTELEVFHPDPESARQFEQEFGATAMYDSVELRRRCCHIRKIEPLNRALKKRPRLADRTTPQPIGNPQRIGFRRNRPQPQHRQVQPHFRLGRKRRLGIRASLRRPAQCLVFPRLPEHRLRTLHPPRQSRRRYPRRTLVVGK